MTKRVICCVIIVTMLGLLFGGCNNEKKINQQKEANLILGNLITALENDDNEAIKNMFSTEVYELLGDELDSQIEEMTEYFEGDVISYDKVGGVSGGDSVKDGKLEFSRISNAHCSKIETDRYIYRLSFSDVIVDNSNKQNEGIWRIWIGKSDDDYIIVGISELPV